jgi:hypothetical protein
MNEKWQNPQHPECRFRLPQSSVQFVLILEYTSCRNSKLNLDESLVEMVLADASHKLVISGMAI